MVSNNPDNAKNPIEWEGFVPGDVIKYKGDKQFIYRGLYNGAPGQFGFKPEPAFGLDHPVNPNQMYFLREIGPMYPAHAFGEDLPPTRQIGSPSLVGFLNGDKQNFEKVGHVTPEDWEQMKRDALAELKGEQ